MENNLLNMNILFCKQRALTYKSLLTTVAAIRYIEKLYLGTGTPKAVVSY